MSIQRCFVVRFRGAHLHAARKKHLSEPLMKRFLVLTAPVFALAVACGDQRDDDVPSEQDSAPDAGAVQVDSGVDASEPQANAPATTEQKTSFQTKPVKQDASSAPIAESCRGFDMTGMLYSPGGQVLPNKCEPYHPTTNNPYAVRCIDAWPWYKTQFPGDQFCILPPPADKGIQYGVHPQGKDYFARVSTGDMSGYDGLSTEWTMDSGEEEETNYQTSAGNEAAANYYRSYARMRPGSHHMIVSTSSPSATQEVWGPGSPVGLLGGTNLPGAQRPDENGPKSLAKPEEDSGLYSTLAAKTGITFNMHHFNATDQTILKEAWTNLWWEDDARIEEHGLLGLELLQTVTLSVAPNTVQDLHYSWAISEPVRLVTAFGHRHAWTTNFSSWIENSDGKLDIVYQSFDWFDEPTYRYDSMTMNPEPAPDKRSDGATSGLLVLQPGQKLHFNCHIEYTDERAEQEGAPRPDEIGTLHFANEAFTAEMCILFGSTAAVQLPTPNVDNSKLPDFAATQ
jgi:hypothetical protein